MWIQGLEHLSQLFIMGTGLGCCASWLSRWWGRGDDRLDVIITCCVLTYTYMYVFYIHSNHSSLLVTIHYSLFYAREIANFKNNLRCNVDKNYANSKYSNIKTKKQQQTLRREVIKFKLIQIKHRDLCLNIMHWNHKINHILIYAADIHLHWQYPIEKR